MAQGPLVAAIVMAGFLAITLAWQVLEIGKERARENDHVSDGPRLAELAERVAAVERRLERVGAGELSGREER